MKKKVIAKNEDENIERLIEEAVRKDRGIDALVEAIWSESLARYGGPFLLGAFSVADAMFAPVATRFKTYAVALSAASQQYADRLLALPAMQDWYAAAAAETEVLPQFEPPA